MRVALAGMLAAAVVLVLVTAPIIAAPLQRAESILDSGSSSSTTPSLTAGGHGHGHGRLSGLTSGAAAGLPARGGHRLRGAAALEARRAARLAAIPVTVAADRVTARLTVDLAAAQPAIPQSFLGISTEYWALPRWARHLRVLDRVLSLVHGPGPLVLRIGGTSADWTQWASRVVSADRPGLRGSAGGLGGSGRRGGRARVHDGPEWAFELTPAWLREVRAIVDRTRARVILDLNTITATPAVAARWARRFARGLPRGRLLGFEIGNEPDLYGPSVFPEAIERSQVARRLPRAISAGEYASSFAAFSDALSSAAPHVPLLGPALAEPDVYPWFITRLLDAPHPGLTEITVHRYPYSACDPPPSPYWPTVRRLLSPAATTGMVRSLAPAIADARRAGLPLRLTELNSVTCGGVRGVSNTFATALWAPDALFALARAGVAAVAVHVRAHAINGAFVLNRRGLFARPLLYGLILFERMLGGSDPHLVSVRLQGRSRPPLAAWAVRSGAILRVLVLDKGRRATGVALRLPGRGVALVQRLLAPSVASTGGVTLAGQHLGRDGRWRGLRVVSTLRRSSRGGALRLYLPAGSAAVVTVGLGSRLATSAPR